MLCKQEDKLMARYGLTFEDLNNDDWRDIFDLLGHKAMPIAMKYVGEHRIDKFMQERHELDLKKQKAYDAYKVIERVSAGACVQHIYDALMEL